MNSPRFFCNLPLEPGLELDLPEDVVRHAVRVLRLPPGASITLFNGQGGEYEATITHIDKTQVLASIGPHDPVERESPLHLTLVQALQAGEKMDYTIQKSVELGVSLIQPVASKRSVVKLSGDRQSKREAHWQSVAISACEQCGRNQVPQVSPIRPLEQWLGQSGNHAGVKLMLAPGAALSLDQLPPTTDRITLLVGAEGGLEPGEIQAAQSSGFIPIRLGPRILRTETAGLAVLAAIQMLWGDFGGG